MPPLARTALGDGRSSPFSHQNFPNVDQTHKRACVKGPMGTQINRHKYRKPCIFVCFPGFALPLLFLEILWKSWQGCAVVAGGAHALPERTRDSFEKPRGARLAGSLTKSYSEPERARNVSNTIRSTSSKSGPRRARKKGLSSKRLMKSFGRHT